MVGGGRGDGYMKFTEVLDKWNVNQGWTEVDDMPEGVCRHSMVASPGNEAIYSFGGDVIGPNNKIFKFTCPDDQIQNCQWEEMGTRLTYPRVYYSVAMTIPVDLANKLC